MIRFVVLHCYFGVCIQACINVVRIRVCVWFWGSASFSSVIGCHYINWVQSSLTRTYKQNLCCVQTNAYARMTIAYNMYRVMNRRCEALSACFCLHCVQLRELNCHVVPHSEKQTSTRHVWYFRGSIASRNPNTPFWLVLWALANIPYIPLAQRMTRLLCGENNWQPALRCSLTTSRSWFVQTNCEQYLKYVFFLLITLLCWRKFTIGKQSH